MVVLEVDHGQVVVEVEEGEIELEALVQVVDEAKRMEDEVVEDEVVEERIGVD